MVNLSSGGNYLGSSTLKTGDIVTFKSEGEWITSDKYKYDDGNFKKSFVMDVTYQNADYKMRVNKTSRDTLVSALGGDTQGWVGKDAVVTIEHARQLKKDVVYLDVAKGKPAAAKTEEEIWED